MPICAWCNDPIQTRSAASRADRAPVATSHGICPSCMSAQLSKLPAPTTAPRPAIAARR